MTMVLTFPTLDDYRVRVRRLQDGIRAAGLDVIALSSFDNHRFLGGVDGIATVRPIWVVIPPDADPVFVSPRIEVPELRQQSWIPVAEEWIEWEEEGVARSAVEALLRVLMPFGAAARIGFDFDATSAATIDALRVALGAERVTDATHIVREARRVKDQATIDVVRRSADIASHQFEASVAASAPGVAEWEIVRASRDAGIARAALWWGGDVEHSPLIQGIHVVGSGPERSPRAHAVGAGRVLLDGDILQLCFCGRPFFGHGICLDRPVRIGDSSFTPELRRVVDVARAAQEAAIERIHPGVTTGELHQAAIDQVIAAGLPSALRHRTGRGIGLSDPEWPEIKAGDPTVLEPGMIIAIEPGVYVDGVGGARFGDTLLVTDQGFEPLTPLDLGRSVV
jgi:Xaa-Pro aminopeptidase